MQRYEHAAPGDLLHFDTKKLGSIERPSHRVTGERRDTVRGAGWEFLFVTIDDHARIGFTEMCMKTFRSPCPPVRRVDRRKADRLVLNYRSTGCGSAVTAP